MHSAVLQNKKYIKFANQNSVEVIAVSGVKDAHDRGEKLASTYEAVGVDGQPAQYMLSWPGLTLEEIQSLRHGKAGSYNHTGGIPFTAVIDPHTQKIIKDFNSVASTPLMEAVKKARKQLSKQHGKSLISRKDLEEIDKARSKALAALAKEDLIKATAACKKILAKQQDWPESVQARVQAIQEKIRSFATARLEAVEAKADSDPKAAKRELNSLMRQLKGTGLTERAKKLKARLAAESQ